MKKIFVPVDFSETSEHAARYAMNLARDMNASVHLFHAYFDPIVDGDLPTYGMEAPSSSPTNTTEAVIYNIEVEARQSMAKLETMLRDEFLMVPLTTETERGFPEVMVSQKAEDMQADLIMMGPRQIPRFFKILTGSITAEVVKESHIPVWIVPERVEYTSIEAVLYASSFEESDTEKLKAFRRIFDQLNYRLMVGFIHDDHGVDYEPEDYMGLRQALTDHIKMSLPNVKIDFMATGDRRLWNGLNELAHDYAADLVIMTTRQRSFFEGLLSPSSTQQMIVKTEKPLLIFHAEVAE